MKKKPISIRDLIDYKKVPSICSYSPKYNSIEKNLGCCNLLLNLDTKYDKNKKLYEKKLLLQKMWKSYNINLDFKVIKLKSYIEHNKFNENLFS